MAKIVDRRTFLKTAAATTAASYAARSLPASAAATEKTLVAVTLPLSTFPSQLRAVRFCPGSRLCGDGLGANSSKGQSSGQGLC